MGDSEEKVACCLRVDMFFSPSGSRTREVGRQAWRGGERGGRKEEKEGGGHGAKGGFREQQNMNSCQLDPSRKQMQRENI